VIRIESSSSEEFTYVLSCGHVCVCVEGMYAVLLWMRGIIVLVVVTPCSEVWDLPICARSPAVKSGCMKFAKKGKMLCKINIFLKTEWSTEIISTIGCIIIVRILVLQSIVVGNCGWMHEVSRVWSYWMFEGRSHPVGVEHEAWVELTFGPYWNRPCRGYCVNLRSRSFWPCKFTSACVQMDRNEFANITYRCYITTLTYVGSRMDVSRLVVLSIDVCGSYQRVHRHSGREIGGELSQASSPRWDIDRWFELEVNAMVSANRPWEFKIPIFFA